MFFFFIFFYFYFFFIFINIIYYLFTLLLFFFFLGENEKELNGEMHLFSVTNLLLMLICLLFLGDLSFLLCLLFLKGFFFFFFLFSFFLSFSSSSSSPLLPSPYFLPPLPPSLPPSFHPLSGAHPSIIQLALSGFYSCGRIAVYYRMNDVFDNIIVTLCRFSSLLPSHSSGSLVIFFFFFSIFQSFSPIFFLPFPHSFLTLPLPSLSSPPPLPSTVT